MFKKNNPEIEITTILCKEIMYRDSFGLQGNKYMNIFAFFECNLTFDALVIQIIHKYALPYIEFNVTYIKHNQFPFDNL